MTTSTLERPETGQIATYTEKITGSWRHLTTLQLVMYWWLYSCGHITRKQLKALFALHEMVARREASQSERTANFTTDEILQLVGGRGVKSAPAEIRRDIKKLCALGVISYSDHQISFAVSVDQIRIEDVSDFWKMFDHYPNRKRKVTVPRRTLRALAAGLCRADTGYMMLCLIRCVFWQDKHERFRIDGRTKLSEAAEILRLDRKSLSNARRRLIDMGWLIPCENEPQQMLNRYGVHDIVNVIDWKPNPSTETVDEPEEKSVDRPRGEGSGVAEFPSPRPQNVSRFPSPIKQDSSSSKIKNKKLSGSAARTVASTEASRGSRKRRGWGSGDGFREILKEDLESAEAVLALYEEFVAAELFTDCLSWKQSFFAMAHRARTRGRNPGGLLRYLVHKRLHGYVTQADEDAARRQLRSLEPETPPVEGLIPTTESILEPEPRTMEEWVNALSEDDRFVHRCILTSKKLNVEPFRIAQQLKAWTQQQWDEALWAYQTQQAQRQRWFA